MIKSELQRFFFLSLTGPHKQRLLLLAVVGLVISSFALLVLQSTMGGLQHKLITRSKAVHGIGFLELRGELKQNYRELADALYDSFGERGLHVVAEYEVELLARHNTYVAPVILRGLEMNWGRPELFESWSEEGIVLGHELSYRLRAGRGSQISFLSAAHTNAVGVHAIPRSVSGSLRDFVITDVPEVDGHHGWSRLSFVQNLVRERAANRLRFYGDVSPHVIRDFVATKAPEENWHFVSWEDQHETLVWALNLENTVMVFLFVAMTFLVALCIMSGLLLFFDRVKKDMASFWILGASERTLERSSGLFVVLMSLLSTLAGLMLGMLALWALHRYGGDFMPAGFVDRKIPVHIELQTLLVSFSVPFGISLIFSYATLVQFRRGRNYLDIVRTVG